MMIRPLTLCFRSAWLGGIISSPGPLVREPQIGDHWLSARPSNSPTGENPPPCNLSAAAEFTLVELLVVIAIIDGEFVLKDQFQELGVVEAVAGGFLQPHVERSEQPGGRDSLSTRVKLSVMRSPLSGWRRERTGSNRTAGE